MSGTPNLLQCTPKIADLWETMRSHHKASSNPPATANPSTAAMTGFVKTILETPIGAVVFTISLGSHFPIDFAENVDAS